MLMGSNDGPLKNEYSVLDRPQPKSHHLATNDKTQILFPKLSKKPAAPKAVFKVDKKLDSKPFVELQEHDVRPFDFEPCFRIVIGGVARKKEVERAAV